MNISEITANDVYGFFNRDDVTEPEWVAAEALIAEDNAREWADYVERRQNFDDAIHQNRNRQVSDAVRKRGIETDWVLVKNGEIVPARIVEGKFGLVWCVKTGWGHDADVVEWVNVSQASTVEKERAHYAKKGYEYQLAEFKIRYGKYGFYVDHATGQLKGETK